MTNEVVTGGAPPIDIFESLQPQLGAEMQADRAGYVARFDSEIRGALSSEPRNPIFSLKRDTPSAISMPVEIGDPNDVLAYMGTGDITAVLGSRAELANALQAGNLEPFWKGERGTKAKSQEDFLKELDKLKKFVAFLDALVKVLQSLKEEYAQTEEDDKKAPASNADAAKRTLALHNVKETLEEINSRDAKGGIASMVGLVQRAQAYVDSGPWETRADESEQVVSTTPIEQAGLNSN